MTHNTGVKVLQTPAVDEKFHAYSHSFSSRRGFKRDERMTEAPPSGAFSPKPHMQRHMTNQLTSDQMLAVQMARQQIVLEREYRLQQKRLEEAKARERERLDDQDRL